MNRVHVRRRGSWDYTECGRMTGGCAGVGKYWFLDVLACGRELFLTWRRRPGVRCKTCVRIVKGKIKRGY